MQKKEEKILSKLKIVKKYFLSNSKLSSAKNRETRKWGIYQILFVSSTRVPRENPNFRGRKTYFLSTLLVDRNKYQSSNREMGVFSSYK